MPTQKSQPRPTKKKEKSVSQINEALAQVRKKLLDLTAHNPLISFNHGRSSRYIRIVDELPDNLTEHLYNSKQLTFKPVPEPNKEELTEWVDNGGQLKGKLPPVELWAKQLRLNISPDLPTDTTNRGLRRYVDLQIQTGYYPSVLEGRLANLYKLARSTIEETGTNLLHLVFGFLEWYESPDSDKPRYAPLYTIPVTINKGKIDSKTNTYLYTLTLSEEEVQFNASLAARLHDDFGFILPEIEDDEEEYWPEDYINEVEKKVSNKFPRWKVHRWGTISLLNFSRLMMYRDLDPANWPEGSSLTDHPLVSSVIGGVDDGENNASSGADYTAEEHNIDDIDNIHTEYPLVDVADSSQHSALIDALDGHNLVIQGPPGTGKSQTITNLIAAAMNQGKTVLFVSEKMAALDVVKQRMERLGLDDFCLELHSHNTKKIGVIDSFKKRCDAYFRSPLALASEINRHTELLDQLRRHANQINQPWKETGKSIQEILVASTRYRNELGEDGGEIRVVNIDGSKWTAEHHANTLRDIRAFHKQLETVISDIGSSNIQEDHPWGGVSANSMDAGSIPKIKKYLESWKSKLQEVSACAANYPGASTTLDINSTLERFLRCIQIMKAAPSIEGMQEWKTLGELSFGGLGQLDDALNQLDSYNTQIEQLGHVSLDEALHSNQINALEESISMLLETRILGNRKIKDLATLQESIGSLEANAVKWTTNLKDYKEFTNEQIPESLKVKHLSIQSLQTLSKLVSFSAKLKGSSFSCRNPKLLPKQLKSDYYEFRANLDPLRTQQQQLSQYFNIETAKKQTNLAELSSTLSETSSIKRIFSGHYRSAKKTVQGFMLNPKQDWNTSSATGSLQNLIQYLEHENTFMADKRWPEIFGPAFKGLDTLPEDIAHLVAWHAELAKEFSGEKKGLFDEAGLNECGTWLLQGDATHLQSLQKFAEAGLAEDIEAIKKSSQDMMHCYGHGDAPVDTLPTDESSPWHKVFLFLHDRLPRALPLCPIMNNHLNLTLDQTAKILNTYLEIRQNWQELEKTYHTLNTNLFSGRLPKNPFPTKAVKSDTDKIRQWCKWTNDPETKGPLTEEVISMQSAELVEKLRAWAQSSEIPSEAERSAYKAFKSLVKLQGKRWKKSCSINKLLARIQQAEASYDILPTYLSFLRVNAELEKKGLKQVCDKIVSEKLPPERQESLCEFAIHASLSDEVFNEIPKLRRFDGMLQSETQKDFKKSDQKILTLMRQRVASTISRRPVEPGKRGARVSDLTEMELLKREMAKQRRHIPVRQLLTRAGKAIQALKPCFMMGPRSVSQYLAPGGMEFDLLVIDEASQMRPADALGAVARCKQLVVVGDSKQLAPTSFFDRLSMSEEEEDDQYEAVISESILDAVAPIFQSRQLRWHYRSRHESLIAFSNHQFYDNRLMLFPSPHFGGEALGIRLHCLEDGVFENQTNIVEAEAVTKRVEELITKDSKISLGIATMNAKQRDLIDGFIEKRSKESPLFAKALEENREADEPLFVKNLENVQGDEREIMIISCTYGKSALGGKVFQRFGPINSTDGWRRLNVLFTRSRTRMEIFSSMTSGDVLLTASSSDGVKALKGMLHFAETKKIQLELPTGREPDSDFEVAVARMLESHGYETACQIGVAGFFIDLAIKHPSKDHQYLVGIECDGATYHSGKSVRDRDRLRQEILENMGWTILRIWSTDWFENPNRAIRPVLKELERHTAMH